MKDLVILLSIYKYLEIPWGDSNIEHTKTSIIHLNIFTFGVLPKPKGVFNILVLVQSGISMMNFKIK